VAELNLVARVINSVTVVYYPSVPECSHGSPTLRRSPPLGLSSHPINTMPHQTVLIFTNNVPPPHYICSVGDDYACYNRHNCGGRPFACLVGRVVLDFLHVVVLLHLPYGTAFHSVCLSELLAECLVQHLLKSTWSC